MENAADSAFLSLLLSVPVIIYNTPEEYFNSFRENYLAAKTFVDACDRFQEEPQACEKREGRAGNNQPRTVPPSWAGQTREAGSGLWAQMTRLDITHN